VGAGALVVLTAVAVVVGVGVRACGLIISTL